MRDSKERCIFVSAAYAVAVNTEGKGLFAFANYNIRTAWTLMEILDAKG